MLEHEPINFGVDIDSLTYHDQLVPLPEVYEPFFWKLDRNREELLRMTNKLMGGTEEFDSAPNERKRARIRYRMWKGGDWEESMCWEGRD
jgi:hypothetical protein